MGEPFPTSCASCWRIAPLVYGTQVSASSGHARARQERPPSLRGYLHQLYAITGLTSRPWLRDLLVPTLVLAGRGDRLAPTANARILARSSPGAQLRVLPCGHLFLLQDTAVGARAVTGFLEDLDRRTAAQPGASTRSTT